MPRLPHRILQNFVVVPLQAEKLSNSVIIETQDKPNVNAFPNITLLLDLFASIIVTTLTACNGKQRRYKEVTNFETKNTFIFTLSIISKTI